jgi:hypothetical protein
MFEKKPKQAEKKAGMLYDEHGNEVSMPNVLQLLAMLSSVGAGNEKISQLTLQNTLLPTDVTVIVSGGENFKYNFSTFGKFNNVIYVAKNGNDSTGTGTQAFPYLTITKAMTVATAGTLVIVQTGSYTESFTVPSNVSLQGSATLAFDQTTTSQTIVNGTITLSSNSNVSSIAVNSSSSYCFIAGGSALLPAKLNNVIATQSTGSSGCINISNTALTSLIISDSYFQVLDSSTGAVILNSSGTSSGVVFFQNSDVAVIDNIDNVCLNIAGSLQVEVAYGNVNGQVLVSNTGVFQSNYSYFNTSTVPHLNTSSTSSTPCALNFCQSNTTASPAFTGTGLFIYQALSYVNTGSGLNSTLNGGAGNNPYLMESLISNSYTSKSGNYNAPNNTNLTLEATGSGQVCMSNGIYAVQWNLANLTAIRDANVPDSNGNNTLVIGFNSPSNQFIMSNIAPSGNSSGVWVTAGGGIDLNYNAGTGPTWYFSLSNPTVQTISSSGPINLNSNAISLTSGSITASLPLIVSAVPGKVYTISNANVTLNTINTVDSPTPANINGASTYSLATPYQSCGITTYDNIEWVVVSGI